MTRFTEKLLSLFGRGRPRDVALPPVVSQATAADIPKDSLGALEHLQPAPCDAPPACIPCEPMEHESNDDTGRSDDDGYPPDLGHTPDYASPFRPF